MVYLGHDLMPSCCNRDSGRFLSTVMARLRASVSVAPCFELLAIVVADCTGGRGRRRSGKLMAVPGLALIYCDERWGRESRAFVSRKGSSHRGERFSYPRDTSGSLHVRCV